MPLLKFMYDDRTEYVCKRGNRTYRFDPTCSVDNEQDARWFLKLRPVTFVVAYDYNQCPYCNTVSKSQKGVVVHVTKKHPEKKDEFKKNHPQFFAIKTMFAKGKTNDSTRNANSDTSGD